MVARAESILSEIRQIKVQYVKEVGNGRRAWPVSIKVRVAELEKLGLTAKSIAAETTIPYATIVLWRFKRRKEGQGFHEVQVANRPALEGAKSTTIAISKSSSVTLPNFEMPQSTGYGQGLSLRTPTGYVIENLSESGVVKLITILSGASDVA
jgi:hypothetical protein